MKKILSVLLAVSLTVCLAIPAFAAGGTSLCYSLSVNGENEITAHKGDIITVQYVITADTNEEQIGVSTAQNELLFDTNFFEFIPGSNHVESALSSYVATSAPVDGTKQYVYFNWTSDLYFDKDTPVEIGSFQLKVIGSSGSGMVTNNNYLAQDSSSALFGAEATDLKVTIEGSTEISVSSVSLNKTSAELKVGDTAALNATVSPSNAANKAVNWTSSNSSVAVVDGNGTVTAKGVGTATITVATVDGNKTASCTVTVTKDDTGGGTTGGGTTGGTTGGGTTGGTTVAVTGVKLNTSAATLKIGESKTLTATVEPSNATNQNVTWSSSNNSVATVDETGKITAKAAGKATITVKSVDGEKTASCEVTVQKPTEDKPCSQDGSCPAAKFTDLDLTAWYHDGVHYCVENSLMQGVSDDKFNPTGTTSRAMIVTILWRMEGCPVVNSAMSFKDVPAGQWYTEAIRWAQSTGVVDGYSPEAFGPDDPITREQMALILCRFAKNHGVDVTNANTLTGYTDVDKVSSWALDAMKWANAVGLVQGRSATTLVPGASIIRVEAATMIQRYCENIK